jgi:hypothetical protein
MDNKLYCDSCKIETKTVIKMEAHCLTEKHKKMIEKGCINEDIDCKICHLNFKCMSAYNIHIETKKHKELMNNNGVKIEYECKICGDLKFKCQKVYDNHINTQKHKELINNNGVKIEYECKICDLKFRCQTSYKIHIDTNKHKQNILFDDTGLNNSCCLYCDYKTDNHSNLKRHTDAHHPNYPKLKGDKLNQNIMNEIYSIIKKNYSRDCSALHSLKKRYDAHHSEKVKTQYDKIYNEYLKNKEIIKKLENKYNLSNKNIIQIEVESEEEEVESEEEENEEENKEEDIEKIRINKLILIKKNEIENLQKGFNDLINKVEDISKYKFLIDEINKILFDIKILEGLIV